MAIIKINTFLPDFYIPGLAQSIDYNRLGIDESIISVDNSVSPFIITVLAGSIIEANGNTYNITADEVFAMSNPAHEYITFNGTTFASAAAIGTWSTEKQGYYDGTKRTLKHSIYNNGSAILYDILFPDVPPISLVNQKVEVYMSANYNFSGTQIIPFDLATFDTCGSFNAANHTIEIQSTGIYMINLAAKSVNATPTGYTYIYVNGDVVRVFDSAFDPYFQLASGYRSLMMPYLFTGGDLVSAYAYFATNNELDKEGTYLTIARLQ